MTEARRFTRAEAGTLFLREGDQLRFAVVHNDRLAREIGEPEMRDKLQEKPLNLRQVSLAGHVALTGDILNLHDSYAIPPDRPYRLDASVDARLAYRTQSVLVIPVQDPAGNILGVLELINALDRTGRIVPFDSQYEGLLRSLAAQAAAAIRNARLENLSLKDAVTDVYNQRYFAVRLEEEFQRHTRFTHPLALALVAIDPFLAVVRRGGRQAGDELLREVARLLLRHSRSFSVITRRGDSNFAIILAHTPKAGALVYAERLRSVVAQHPFAQGTVTASLGVAALPDDGTTVDDLLAAADRALCAAAQDGGNRTVGS